LIGKYKTITLYFIDRHLFAPLTLFINYNIISFRALYFDGESEGIDCSWYADNETNCGKFGNKKNYDGTKANEACCACGGGLNPSGTGTEGKECIDSDKLKYKGKKKYSCTWLANKNTKQIRKLCKTKAWEDIKLKDWCPETCGNAGVGKCK